MELKNNDKFCFSFNQGLQSYLFPIKVEETISGLLLKNNYTPDSITDERVTWFNIDLNNYVHFNRYIKVNGISFERVINNVNNIEIEKVIQDDYKKFMDLINLLVKNSEYPFISATMEFQFSIISNELLSQKDNLLHLITKLHSDFNLGCRVDFDIVDESSNLITYFLTPSNFELCE